ncbi:family 10 glycosylhydrolase [Fontivita pretiosa]|uniref:family 10 glycosylhydrolase n=1 Tax=Fontivita pretiosa TaxID=2989684 RepID=UPI003D16A184
MAGSVILTTPRALSAHSAAQKLRGLLAAASLATLAPTPLAHADLVADQTPFHSYRGWWVDRFDYSNAASIVTMFNRAQQLGITDVMFQVRGQADAYYYLNDNVEVYAQGRNISASFDPLAIALNEGHARGIRVHAWLNMAPLWNGTSLPTNPNHLLYQHDEFWIRDSSNNKQPLNSGYVIVNPTRDDVQAHLNNVVKTIAKNYNVDGIHLDYIRLYENHGGSSTAINFPSDPQTVARFQLEYPGQTPTSHRANYKTWLAKEISDLVRSVRQTLKQQRPGAQLTAAVWRDADIGLDSYQQDWATWIDQGLLDAAMPMIYRKGFGDGGTDMDPDSGDLYRSNVSEALWRAGTAGIMPGIGSYMQDDPTTAYNNVWNQLVYAKQQGANGIQLFDYGSLYNGSAAQTAARQAISDFFAAHSAAAAPVAISNFDSDEGYFIRNITFSGSNLNVASGSADRVSDESRGSPGGGSQRIIINTTPGASSFLARHVSGTTNAASPDSNLTFSSIGSIGFWLKTTTPDLEVAVAVDDNPANTSTERGYFQNVIADGQWHYYQWFLNDPAHWDAWAGTLSDGRIDNLFTLDSIQFRGTAQTNTIWLDDVSYDAAARAPNQWTLDSAIYTQAPDTNWTNAANWTGGVPNGPGATANLLRRPSGASQTVTVNAPITLGTLNIDNRNSYLITGSATITMDVASGAAAVNVINRGSHTIAAPIRLNDPTRFAIDVGATLAITGPLNASGSATLSKNGQGTLLVSNFRLSSLVIEQGLLKLPPQSQGSGATDISTISSLSILDSGRLDLTNNSLRIDYDGGSPIRDVRNMLLSGALFSSWADANWRLGYSDSVGSGEVLIQYALGGDANLDGVVNALDLDVLTASWQQADALWTGGDFSYDGVVNIRDLYLLALNWQAGGLAGALEQIAARGLPTNLPEPTGVGWVMLGSVAMRRVRPGRSRRARLNT